MRDGPSQEDLRVFIPGGRKDPPQREPTADRQAARWRLSSPASTRRAAGASKVKIRALAGCFSLVGIVMMSQAFSRSGTEIFIGGTRTGLGVPRLLSQTSK